MVQSHWIENVTLLIFCKSNVHPLGFLQRLSCEYCPPYAVTYLAPGAIAAAICF